MNTRKPIAVITGVSSGIGATLAVTFIKSGYVVYGSVRRESDARELLESYPKSFRMLLMDVTDDESVKASAQKVIQDCPDGIDLLINNAGIAVGGPLLHLPIAQLSYQLEVNVVGVIRVCQEFAPLLKEKDTAKKAGRIIQIGSVSGKIGMPFIGPYSASKHALEGVSDSLRRELKLYGIDVILVGPGAIKTPIWQKSIEPVATGYTETPYAASIQNFQKHFVNSAVESGLSPEYLAERIVKIATQASPKTRYTFVSKRLTNWVAPRFLPARWIDNLLASKLFS